jgi:hypothetical protein
MQRFSAILLVTAMAIGTALVGYLLALAIAPNPTVCIGTPTDGYCETHASHWTLVGLLVGLVIGAGVAIALVRRSRRSPAV